MEIYIYTLSDDNNNVKYVGQTKNINIRLRKHIYDAINNGGGNKRCSWIKSLINKNKLPVIDIIDVVPKNEWVFWEKYWISQFKAWGFKLTNMTDGGDGKYGHSPSIDTKNKISLSHKSKLPKNYKLFRESTMKIVLQYDLNGEFIKEWESIITAKKELKIDNISFVLTGRRLTAGGFIWSYKDNPLTKEKLSSIISVLNKQEKKPVLQLNLNGEFIKEWESVRSVRKIYPHINSILNGSRKTAGGYLWVYK